MGPALKHELSSDPGWSSATLVLRNRPVRAGAPPHKLSRFGDMVWHLSPAHPDANKTVNAVHWQRWPAELVPGFKIVALALLEHPRPATTTTASEGDLLGIDTVSIKLRDIRAFAEWMSQHDLRQICEVTDQHLEKYRSHVLALTISNGRKGSLLAGVRLLWDYRAHLPPECRLQAISLWGGASMMHLANMPAPGRENKTPRIAPATMEALLAWSLRMIEDLGPDIAAALLEFQQLEADTHPSQEVFHGLPARRRSEIFLARAAADGTALPGLLAKDGSYQVNWGHFGRLLGMKLSASQPTARQAVLDSGLPISHGSFLGTVTGRIDGRLWREHPITVQELPDLVSHLSTACFVIISYLSGMRPGEALNLRRGCSRRDETTGQLFIDGRHGKGTGREPRPAVGEDAWERSWVVVQPVHDAIAVLESLSDSPFLFPSSLVAAQARRPADEHARVSRYVTRDLGRFISWLNDTFVRPDGQPVVPPDLTRTIHPSRFRRTLAYFIVRRPRGLIAAALQYAHVSTKVTLSYAGQANPTWLEDVAIERLELIVEQSEQDWTLLQHGEHISGPAAPEYEARVARSHQFAGRVVNRVRNVERLVSQVDPSIHHGEGMTCVWQAETAACRATRIAQGLPAGDAPVETECQSTCQNLAYTDRDIAQLHERLAALEAGAADALAPRPLQDRAAAQAAQVRKVLDRHKATASTEPAEEKTA
jgi:integrase